MDNSYLKLDVETAAPIKRVVMLYEKAILCMEEAKVGIETDDLKRKIENILRAHDIIRVLNVSLDMEKGGEISENLRELYDFIEVSLTKVNASNDTVLLNDVMEIVSTLKSAWEEIESKV